MWRRDAVARSETSHTGCWRQARPAPPLRLRVSRQQQAKARWRPRTSPTRRRCAPSLRPQTLPRPASRCERRRASCRRRALGDAPTSTRPTSSDLCRQKRDSRHIALATEFAVAADRRCRPVVSPGGRQCQSNVLPCTHLRYLSPKTRHATAGDTGDALQHCWRTHAPRRNSPATPPASLATTSPRSANACRGTPRSSPGSGD